MAARRPRNLKPNEILKLLQDLSENESDDEEQSIDNDMDYEPSQNDETKDISSDSDESMVEESSNQNIQPMRIPTANNLSAVPVASTSASKAYLCLFYETFF